MLSWTFWSDLVSTYFGPIDIMLGLIAATFSGISVVRLWRYTRSFRKSKKVTLDADDKKNVVFAIFIRGIQAGQTTSDSNKEKVQFDQQVQRYATKITDRKGNQLFTENTVKNWYIPLHFIPPSGAMTEKDIDAFKRDLLEKKQLLTNSDVVHVIYRGPGIVGMTIGSFFKNSAFHVIGHQLSVSEYASFGEILM